MKRISGLILVFFVSIFSIPVLLAVPASPYPITLTQSDGTEITFRLRGDEHFKYKTTLDGYVLVPDNIGILTYGRQDATGNLVSTNVKARNIDRRTAEEIQLVRTLPQNINFSIQRQKSRAMRVAAISSETLLKKAYPLIGSPKSLVILVNFSDKSFVTSTPQTAYTNLLNQNGYSANNGTGSAKDYFRDNSMGVFEPQFDVVGPYKLPQTMDYYGKNDSNNDDVNPRKMVIDACTKADAAGVDFSQYDTDADGIVDNVFIYYAGYNEAEGAPANTVWPHRWSLSNYNTKFDDVIVYDYACTSELRGTGGSNMCGIGTFTHEFGHVLGLPDLYNTDGVDTYQTLSVWDIMDTGPYLNSGRTPPAYSAYERFFLKWLVPTELKAAGDYSLEALTGSNKAYLISQNGNHNLNGSDPSPVEFYMLENRQNISWDTYLPGHGMLITHIYYNATDWGDNVPNNNPNAMGVDIVEADSKASETTLNGDPYPGTGKIVSYNPTLRSGVNIQKPLTRITETNRVISFRFIGVGNVPVIETSGTLSSFKTVQGTPSESGTIAVSGKKLKANIELSFGTNINFQMKKESDPESSWAKTISLTPTDSIVSKTNIQIRYNPIEPSYATIHTESFVLNSTGAETVAFSLAGTSTRPVYVVPPVATEATETTIASFVAHWDSVYDASGYYLTIYNFPDGESKSTEGFDNGLVAPTGWTINATSLSTSAAYSGVAIPAIQFRNTNDSIQTEKYQLPATNLSFYIRSLSVSNGYVMVKASDGTTWSKIDSIPTTASLNTTKAYSFSSDKNYSQFSLTYTNNSGYIIYIDDVTVGFSQTLEYSVQDKWITATSDTIINLASNRDYYYEVKASDKVLNNDKSIKYENITAFSNLIKVRTLEDKSKNGILIAKADSIYVNNTGTIFVYLPSTNVTLNVYSILGQLIRSIQPRVNKVEISGLPRQRVYIIQAGKQVSKVIL